MRLLVIEARSRTAELVLKGLAESGHVVDHAVTDADGLHLATEHVYDVVILDRPESGEEGLTLLRKLRARKVRTPVILVSVHHHVDERVLGLRAGADDYLCKPFAFIELQARVEALARRRRRRLPAEEITLRADDLEVDLLGRLARRGGQLLKLKQTEFRLLECLLRNAGAIVSRETLFATLWNQDFEARTNVIDVHVARLRQRIDRPGEESMIVTVRGAGYGILRRDARDAVGSATVPSKMS